MPRVIHCIQCGKRTRINVNNKYFTCSTKCTDKEKRVNKNLQKKECCDIGSYECQVPMPLNGRLQSIDYCIADIVAALNAANIITVASCCGHNKIQSSIVLEDGRELAIKNVRCE